MARYQAVQTNFRVGQISPRLQGYVDLPDYQNALKTLENMVVLPQSSISRRPGTKFVAETADNSSVARLIPFNFGQGESYVLEFTNEKIRIFYNDPADGEPKLIPDTTALGGITSPYLEADLDEINWTQSADTLFIVHPSYAPRRLKRSGQDLSQWTLDLFPFDDGPYLPVNTELTWLRFSNVDDADYNNQKIGEIPTGSGGGVDDTENIFTLTNHSLVDGESVYFDMDDPTHTLPAPLVTGKTYYVVQSTLNTFKVSNDLDGAVLDLTTNGTNNGSMHVHRTFLGEGGEVTLTAYKGTKIDRCTFNQSTDTFTTAEAHGLLDTDEVHFKTGTVDGFSLDTNYYVFNKTSTTFQLKDASGTLVTVAGSRTAVPVGGLYKMEASGDHINDGVGFQSDDFDRLIRINSAVRPTIKWGYVKILSVNSTTEVDVKIIKDLGPPTETQSWALGAFSGTTGYPRCATIFQQRMVFAGTEEEPQTVHFSKTGDYLKFSTTEAIGEQTGIGVGGTGIFGEQIYDDNGLSLAIASDTVDKITYLAAQQNLTVGTTGGVFQMFGARDDVTLTPFNFSVVKVAAWPAAQARPVEIGNRLVYVQQTGRKLRALDYKRTEDEYSADDITLRSENVSATGIAEIYYQDQPNSLVWCRRNDGRLACVTFVSAIPLIAWHLHTIGGTQPDATYGDHAKVESMAVIPQEDHDQLWLVVKRQIIELGAALSSLTFDMTTGVFSKASHGLSDGDEYVFEAVPDEMAPYFDSEKIYYVVSTNTGTFKLSATEGGDPVNPSDITGTTDISVTALKPTAYNTVRYVEVMQKFFDLSETNIEDAWFVDCGKKTSGSDLSSVTIGHLNGQTLSFLGDGAPQPDKKADYSDGSVALNGVDVADTVIAGLGYSSNIETLPLTIGDRRNSSVGQRKRINHIVVQLLESMGIKYGVEASNLFEEDFRLTSDLLNQPVPLFSGQKELAMPGAFTRTGEIYLRQEQALPFTVTLIAVDYETND